MQKLSFHHKTSQRLYRSQQPVTCVRARRGAALVEAAIVLPLFFLTIFAIVEFGRAMMVSQLVTNAARLGARAAILEGSSNTDVTKTITDFLKQSTNVNAADVTVAIEILPDPDNKDPAGQLSSSNLGDIITVKVDVPFNNVALLPGTFLKGKKLNGIASMRHE